MWVVIKYKRNQFFSLKKNIIEKLGTIPNFYNPKIKYQKIIKNKLKTFETFVLENYLFCYHPKFCENRTLTNLKFTKGLCYFLGGNSTNQNEIINFIKYCKNHEDKNGFIKQEFFNNEKLKKAKFISGPFTNLMFEIIETQKNKIKILIGNKAAIISKNSEFLYRHA